MGVGGDVLGQTTRASRDPHRPIVEAALGPSPICATGFAQFDDMIRAFITFSRRQNYA